MDKSYLRVLGSANWQQTAFNDHSCYTVNDQILIDACPSVVTQLQEHGVDPLDLTTVCFTHMHCDHYMGLAPLLHYWRVVKKTKLGGLTILGPKETVRETVMRTLLFVFATQEHLQECVTEMPNIVELADGAEYRAPGYRIETTDSFHAVPGLCYRITDERTGRVIGFSGDTAYQQKYGPFFQGVNLLVHECSYGVEPAPQPNKSRHSTVFDAAQVCEEAGAERLLLTHAYAPKREAALLEAHKRLTTPVEWAMPHQVFPY